MRTSIVTALLAVIALLPVSVLAADTVESRLQALEQELGRQAATIQEQRKLIEELKQRVSEQATDSQQNTEAVSPRQDTNGSKLSGLFGGSLMTNPYISVILDAKGYVSNLKNSQLGSRGVPGYTTEGPGLRNGFNVDAAELMIFAPVDPYFNLYTNIPVTSDGATLEEAYFVTTALPEGFQIKGGRFKSNASRLNAQHPHAWDFTDLPLPYRAFLGQEGIGGENGVQLTWMPSLPVYTLLGFEALQGDNPLLFGNNSNQGPHAFTTFARVSFDTSEDSSLYLSPWAMFGTTNSTLIRDGFEMRGDSSLYGLEAVWKWKNGHQKFSLQGEYLYLVQNGNLIDVSAVVPDEPLKRHQDGAYLQAMYHLDRWGGGMRYDRMEIFSDTFQQGGVQQTFSGKPWRLTGSLEYNPTEFSRIRAQFTHDRSDRSGLVNNEGILQFKQKEWSGRQLKKKPFFAQHKFFEYLAGEYGFPILAYLEEKPGIPPASAHLERLISNAAMLHPRAILTTDYHGPGQAKFFSSKTGVKTVVVPHDVGAAGTKDWFSLMDAVFKALEEA